MGARVGRRPGHEDHLAEAVRDTKQRRQGHVRLPPLVASACTGARRARSAQGHEARVLSAGAMTAHADTHSGQADASGSSLLLFAGTSTRK